MLPIDEVPRPTHEDVCAAALTAADIERGLDYSDGFHSSRYDWWLTEAELIARVRGALVEQGAALASEMQLNAQGRAADGRMNNDILIGYRPRVAIEVVYCGKSVGKALDEDLEWLTGGALDGSRHVIAFFPKMRVGYRIQGHETVYDPAGTCIALAPCERVLSDCISCIPMGSTGLALEAYAGLVEKIGFPRGGRTPRYSLASPITDSGSVTFRRTVVATPDDNLWAVVWTC